jgi:branched-chain amino acid transport system substrate-binding protein
VSQLDRRRFLTLLGAAGAAVPLLSACGNSSTSQSTASQTDDQTIRVGLVIPQKGTNKPLGDDLTFGFELYLNLHGTKLGNHPVQLFLAEEGDDADSGKAAVNQLVKQHNCQILSGVASPVVMTGIRDTVEAAQVPLIGSNGSPSDLGGVKYIWRTSYVSGESGKALGGYVADTMRLNGGGRLYVISDDSTAARDEVTNFLASFNATSGHPTLAASPVIIPASAHSYKSYLDAIDSSGANTVFAYLANDAAGFVKAYASSVRSSISLYAPGFLTEGDLLRQEGTAATGIYTSSNYSPSLPGTSNQTFGSEYQKAFNNPPSAYAMASYDAAAVLDKALGLTRGDVSAQSINAAIGQIGEIDSPRGRWQFNQTRTPLQQWYLRQVRNDGQVLSNVVLRDLATLG